MECSNFVSTFHERVEGLYRFTLPLSVNGEGLPKAELSHKIVGVRSEGMPINFASFVPEG